MDAAGSVNMAIPVRKIFFIELKRRVVFCNIYIIQLWGFVKGFFKIDGLFIININLVLSRAQYPLCILDAFSPVLLQVFIRIEQSIKNILP